MDNSSDSAIIHSTTHNDTGIDIEVAKRGWPAVVINMICVSGLIGYSVYVYILIKHKQAFNNPFYHLSGSMLISDVINLFTEIIYSVPAMLFGESQMPDTYRRIVGYFSDGSWFWSSSHMAVIGANRVVAVCMYSHYQQLFNARNVYILMGVCWVYGFFMVTLMYACTCEYYFTSYSWVFACLPHSCQEAALKINQVCSNSLVISVVLSYVSIFIQVRRTSRRIKATGKASDKKQKRELQLVFQFVVIGVSLSIYELLFWIVPPLMASNSISDYAGLNVMNIFGVVNSSIHPFLYIFFGSEVKQKIFVTDDGNGKGKGEVTSNQPVTKAPKGKENMVVSTL